MSNIYTVCERVLSGPALSTKVRNWSCYKLVVFVQARLRSRDGDVPSARAAEIDEMWRFVGAKKTERGLWQAIDHRTGKVLASVVGARKDAEFLTLHALLAPVGIEHDYTDKGGVYQRRLPPVQHTGGNLTMQKIERKHSPLRTRLKRFARKTPSFSRSCVMHDLALGLYMKYVECGCAA